jgi:hypothetical protein
MSFCDLPLYIGYGRAPDDRVRLTTNLSSSS